jgi:hypothetical protein
VARTAVELLLLIIAVLCLKLPSLRQRLERSASAWLSRARRPESAPPPARPPTPLPIAPELCPLRDAAFDYERLVLEMSAQAPVAECEHALHVISHLIVPLVGHVRVCDLDDELVRSVERVLAAQLSGERGAYAALLWKQFADWSRERAEPSARRKV